MNNEVSDITRLSEPSSLLLDGLRGIAAQLVVVGHLLALLGLIPYLNSNRSPKIQNLAVVVFFALSGFLITYSAIHKRAKRADYGFGSFMIDRASRVFTPYVPALFIILLLDWLSIQLSPQSYQFSGAFDATTFVGNLFMLQDFPKLTEVTGIEMTSFGTGRPLWTVAVEWWIYLGFGWLFFKLRDGGLKSLVIGLPLLIVPIFVFYTGRGNGLGVVWLMGSLLACIFVKGRLGVGDRELFWLASFVTAVTTLVTFFVVRKAYAPTVGVSIAVCLYLWLEYYQRFPSGRLIQRPTVARFMRGVASFSFTLYLVHYSVIELLMPLMSAVDPWLQLGALFVVSNIVSIALYHLAEKHHLGVRKWMTQRFFSSTSRAAGPH